MYSNDSDLGRPRLAQRRRLSKPAPDAARSSPPTLLQQALKIFYRSTVGEPDLDVELPSEGRLRMRNLVHRGTQRPVFKVTSLKLDRVVHCESILEVDAVLRLDIHPEVTSYAEQPVRLQYLEAGKWRRHIPDFAVLTTAGELVLLEVKFERDLSDEVRRRTGKLQNMLAKLGVNYRLITQREIQQGNILQNAHRLLRRARHTVSDAQLLRTVETLRRSRDLPLAAFGWNTPNSQEAVCIAQLILRGHVAFHIDELLTSVTRVWLVEAAGQGVGERHAAR